MAKGFGKQSALYKGWLIEEARKGFQDDLVDVRNLYTIICSAVGTVSGRKVEEDAELRAHITVLLLSLDKEQREQIQSKKSNHKRWISRLATDEEFYVNYVRHIADLIKAKVFDGELDEVNGLFKETDQYQQWMEEAGFANPRIRLISRIFHPLTTMHECEETGESLTNLWGTSSMMAAIACDRKPKGATEDPKETISLLLQEGVLSFESYEARLEAAHTLDSVYLELIFDIHQMLERKEAEEASA